METQSDNKAFEQLQQSLQRYGELSSEDWQEIRRICRIIHCEKGKILLMPGHRSEYMYFIANGCMRSFYLDDEGNSYNKNLFLEGSFPASAASLITGQESILGLETLEVSQIIQFSFSAFRKAMLSSFGLQQLYIAYIERHWIVEKELREISLVTEDAEQRYCKLLVQYPNIDRRIAQKHLASHLGITPTQLSRIRKHLKK